MSNFHPRLEDATDKELMVMINELSPQFTILASDELTRRKLIKLQETITTFNNESSKQTNKMIVLAWWVVGLTIAMLFGLIIQIIISL